METTPLSRTEREVVAANNGMSHYLRQLEVGREATPHSWLYENESSEKTLDRWLTTLDLLKREGEFGDEVYQFDTKQIEKFGPQGKVPPVSEGLEELKDSYASNESRMQSIPDYDARCRQLAEILFGKDQLNRNRPLRYELVIDDMRERDTLNTNSGWPLFTRRNKEEVKRQSIEDARSLKAFEYPAILLFRAYNGKLRPVWMYPMSLNLIEFSFTMKIQDVMRRRHLPYITPWEGFEDVERQFTADWSGLTAISGDTTKMDAHFKVEQMRCVYDIVRHLFQPQYHALLWETMRKVNEIEVVVGPDSKLTGSHGIASGSGWTQLAETIFQMWMCFNAQYESDWLTTTLSRGMGIGDDFVWFADVKDMSVAAVSEGIASYLETFGLPANPSKQEVGKEKGYFLQRMFQSSWTFDDLPVSKTVPPLPEQKATLAGIYPTVRALNSLLNPERFYDSKKWNSDMFCIRCYMILENCVGHPLFEQFVQFVVRGQKDLLPFAHKTDAEILAAQDEARSIPSLTPTYNQRLRSKPLTEYTSIKYARTL